MSVIPPQAVLANQMAGGFILLSRTYLASHIDVVVYDFDRGIELALDPSLLHRIDKSWTSCSRRGS